MKRSLLLIATMLLTSLASFADGLAKPTLPAVGVPAEDGQECYIMNVQAGMFFTGAKVWHSWESSTALADKGQLSVLKKSGDNWFICRKSDNKHTFISNILGDTRKGDFGEANGRFEMHVDMASQGHDAWEFVEAGNGDYKIRIAAKDDLYGSAKYPETWENTFMGWLGENHKYPNAVYGNVTAEEGAVVWRLVSVAAYDAYQLKFQLAELIQKATDEYSVNCDDETAVYNNPDATVAQIQAAIKSVKAKVAAAHPATWAKPTVEGMTLADGLKCYIMNTESGTALAGAKTWYSWATSAGVTADGMEYELQGGEGVWYLARTSDKKHTFISGEKEFVASEGVRYEMHVDMNAQGHDKWEILPNGDAYRFRIAAEDDVYGLVAKPETWENAFIGWLGANQNTPNAVYGNVTPEEGAVDWKFVDSETLKTIGPKFAVYNAAVALKAAIDAAKEECPGINLSEVEAVYNYPESTVDELNAATARIAALVEIWKNSQKDFSSASWGNPMDITDMLQNPSFETGDLTGWNVEKHNVNANEDASDMGVKPNSEEKYTCDNTDGDYLFNIWAWGNPITQTIYGLPEGVYTLRGMLTSSDDCTNQFLIAEGAILPEGEMQHAAVALEANPADGTTKQTRFTDGSLTFVAGADAADKGIVIGAVGCDADGVSYVKGGRWWYKADNFRLEYCGKDEAGYAEWVKSLGLTTYNPEEEQATTSLLNQYNDIVNSILNATSGAESVKAYKENFVKMTELKALIAANMTAWQNYLDAIETANEKIGNLDGESEQKDKLIAYLSDAVEPSEEFPNGTSAYIVEQKTLTTDQIQAEIEFLNKLVVDAVAHTMSAGMDVTDMLANPDFKQAGAAGWTHNLKASNFAGRGGMSAFPCAESWHSHFDISQTIEGVSEGIYSISLNGFCRRDDANEKVKGEVYMNDFATPMMDIYEGGLDVADAIDGFNCYLTDDAWKTNPLFDGASIYVTNGSTNKDNENDGFYTPNGMGGASIAFSADRYKATTYGLVTKGEPMTIGVRNLVSTHQWVLWSNFKLTFEGKRASAIAGVLNGFVAQLNKIDENMEPMFKEWWDVIYQAMDDMQTDADAVAEYSDDDDVDEYYDKLMAYNETMNTIRGYQAKMADIYAKLAEVAVLASDPYAQADDRANEIYERFKNSEEFGKGTYVLQLEAGTALEEEWMETFMADYYESLDYLKKLILFQQLAQEEPSVITVDDATTTEGEDVTEQLVNAGITDKSPWTDGTEWAVQEAAPSLGEMYNKTFNVYQTVQFTQPGWYVASTVSFDRRGSWDNEKTYMDEQNDTCFTNMYAFMATMENGADTLGVAPIKSGAAMASPVVLGAAGTEGCETRNDMWFPNNMTRARAWFDDPEMKAAATSSIVFEVTNTDVKYRIGIEKKVAPAASWFITDGLTLTYFATEEAARATGITTVEEAAERAINGKFLINGKLVIVKDGIRYNVTGMRIK